MFKAILTFISQDVTAYLKSGILQLRSSWKLYSRIHKQLFILLQKFDPNADQLFDFDQTKVDDVIFDDEAVGGADEEAKEEDEAIHDAIEQMTINDKGDQIDVEAVKRLLGAVSFGYGIFQIFMSFIPTNYLKLFSILGNS